jgi:hypothetical protein
MIPIHQLDAADNVARRLKLQGVEVEVRPEKVIFHKNDTQRATDQTTMTSDSTDDKEKVVVDPFSVVELDPINLFRQFMEEVVVFPEGLNKTNSSGNSSFSIGDKASSSAIPVKGDSSATATAAASLKAALVHEGIATLEQLLSNEQSCHNINAVSNSNINNHHYREIRDLQLQSVSLKNFGPYGGDRINYPLANRGLVLIRGQSMDGTGADSNGSGKVLVYICVSMNVVHRVC